MISNKGQGSQILPIWSIFLQIISTDSNEVMEGVTLTPEIWQQQNNNNNDMCFLFILTHSKLIYDNFKLEQTYMYSEHYLKKITLFMCVGGLRKKIQSNAFTQLPSWI